MNPSDISRKNFIKSAAAGMGAAAAASAYFNGSDTNPNNPFDFYDWENNGYVEIKKNQVVLYPSGFPEVDQMNIQGLIDDISLPNKIYMKSKAKDGDSLSFKLPCCDEYNSIIVSRNIWIIGQSSPKGNGTTIEDGYAAFEWLIDENPPSLHIEKVAFRNQQFTAVYGYFNDFSLDGGEVSVNPMPPPSPEVNPMPPPDPQYGIFLEKVYGSMEIKNSSITNIGGIVCKKAARASITNTRITSTLAGIYLADVQNSQIKDNVIDNYNAGFANIILDGPSSMNEIKGGKFVGNALFGALILSKEESSGNSVLSVDMKKFGLDKFEGQYLSVAGVGIIPLFEGSVNGTTVKAGPGSVSVNPMPPPAPEVNPMPPPRGIVINSGTDSHIDKRLFIPSDIELPPIFYDALTPFKMQIGDPFGDGGDIIIE